VLCCIIYLFSYW